jgi:putative ABC transport system permease protein
MQALRDDLRLAFRAVVSRPGTSWLVVLSVAVAIGANTAFFGVMRGFMWQPLPYPQQDRLVVLWQLDRTSADPETAVSPADFLTWQREVRGIGSLSAFEIATHAVTSTTPAEEVTGARVTPGLLPLFGARVVRGRSLEAADAAPGAPPVALLTDDYWRRRFGADPGVVGRTIRLDERETTVVGVLAHDFSFVYTGFGLWTPLAIDPANASRDAHDLIVFGRLAPGITASAATAELDALARRQEALHPDSNRGLGAMARRLRDEVPGPTDRKLFSLVQGAIALLLLIASANVANVLVARGQDRQRELAVRTALGASRGRTLRQLLTESLLLAGAASAGGLVLAAGLIGLLRKALAGSIGTALLPTLDLLVVAFNVGLAAAAALLFGLGPALAAARPDLAVWLRQRVDTAPRRRLQRLLVVLEVTLALVMLSATGLLVTSLRAMRTLDSGFASERLLTFRLSLPSRYAPAVRAAAFERVRGELAAAPGVAAATAVTSLPRSRNTPSQSFTVEGEPPREGRPASTIALSVADGYFATMEIPLRAGRTFGAGDRAGTAPVALVSSEFARRYLGRAPLGRRVVLGGRAREVVGVVADVVQTRTLDEGGLRNPVVYLPLAQEPAGQLSFVLRARRDPESLAAAAREAVRRVDPQLVAAEFKTMREHIDAQFGGARVFGAMLAGFAAIALALAALGVYGVISYAVSRRRREIAIRMAVGARPGAVVRELAGQGARMTALGLALAVPAVALVARGIASIFAGNFPMVWATVPAIAALLTATALLASWVPARRAARLDPSAVLAEG